MFRRRKTVINGVELPEDFNTSSVINNIAISNDGRYAAVTKSGDVIIADIPKSGRIEVDGIVLNYQKGTGKSKMNIRGSNVSMSSFSGGSVVISGGGSYVSIGKGSDLEYEIDQSYDNISRLFLNEQINDISVGLSNDGKVHVKGFTSREPEYRGSRLIVDRLEGSLLLPESMKNFEQDLKTMSGDIDGDIANKGRMKTISGDISIRLLSPLIVETSTISGDIDVRGMMADGRARYKPPTGNPLGNLYLETISGDIDVRYEAK